MRQCRIKIGDIHINGGEATVGDGTADGTGEGESRVKVDTGRFCWVGSDGLVLQGIELDGARRGGRYAGRHGRCVGMRSEKNRRDGRRWDGGEEMEWSEMMRW